MEESLLFESSSPAHLLFLLEMLQFSESTPEFFELRGVRGLFWDVTHSLRNLAMINDHRAAHSFKQQTFPREKILYIRNERSKRVFLYLPFKITFCPRAFAAKIARSLRIGLARGSFDTFSLQIYAHLISTEIFSKRFQTKRCFVNRWHIFNCNYKALFLKGFV